MSKGANIQDQFLNRLKDENRPITIVVTNGYQLKGRIVDYDQFTILLDADGQHQLVYKANISTIKEA